MLNMGEDLKSELLKTWEAWDEYPGGEKTAKDRIRAINDFAESINRDPLIFRRELAQARRDGLTREESLERVLNDN